ncbi:hypothetical protein [Cohnella kolymensis]|uniref:hypothetical protein n=1 Tax=Cohnella kolymensis TaxID=1590652 RepID=UPI0006979EC3|nr:hypothetical protein [Cohnella kolymensis]
MDYPIWALSERFCGKVIEDQVYDETEAFMASPLTIVCVRDDDAVHAIVGPLGEVLRGRTLVNLTTDSPVRAR